MIGYERKERIRKQRPGEVVSVSGLRRTLASIPDTPERQVERQAYQAWIDAMLASVKGR